MIYSLVISAGLIFYFYEPNNKKKINKKLKKKIKLCIAESITGGNLHMNLLKKNASSFIDYSLVCYSNDSKIIFLGFRK